MGVQQKISTPVIGGVEGKEKENRAESLLGWGTVSVAWKGSPRHPCGDGNVVHLDAAHISIMVVLQVAALGGHYVKATWNLPLLFLTNAYESRMPQN